jgi:hypothetical protein
LPEPDSPVTTNRRPWQVLTMVGRDSLSKARAASYREDLQTDLKA